MSVLNRVGLKRKLDTLGRVSFHRGFQTCRASLLLASVALSHSRARPTLRLTLSPDTASAPTPIPASCPWAGSVRGRARIPSDTPPPRPPWPLPPLPSYLYPLRPAPPRALRPLRLPKPHPAACWYGLRSHPRGRVGLRFRFARCGPREPPRRPPRSAASRTWCECHRTSARCSRVPPFRPTPRGLRVQESRPQPANKSRCPPPAVPESSP